MASSAPDPANTAKAGFVKELLQRAHSPSSATYVYDEKIRDRPLFLRPTDVDVANARTRRQRERARKDALRRKSQKPRPFSAREKRALGVHDIPSDQQKYAIFEPLHRMWCAYMRDILGLQKDQAEQGIASRAHVTPETAGPMLVSADFHGAELEVVRCRCVDRVGIKGIVAKDTKFAFELITRRNQLKLIPKEHTVFRFEIPLGESNEESSTENQNPPKRLIFELHGDQFIVRAGDRANKKFKAHVPKNL
ncbi:Rof/RNase P-like protein [Lineolata rhizophorae]|uniref:Ribonuclease P protein subunit n=1 Tax=Lineolata rhizophorae TaxID=578093 RepID=A0A6A6P537_9PEZI|nr:Rof/RNase P-like protein [Lineolata rhizophorae]